MAEWVLASVLIGAGATAIFDLWGQIMVRVFGLPGSNWTLAGRWFCHVAHGRPILPNIAEAPAFRHETALGWIVHYLIGISYAALLLAIWGLDWARQPSIGPALIVGIGTILAGWLIMAPAMGMGIASARHPRKPVVRIVQLVAHTVFGIGLYAAARLLAPIFV